jgi:hypothetical protein
MKRTSSLLFSSCLLLIALVPTSARADLSAKQARTLITKLAGSSLPSSSVHVQKPVMLSAVMAKADADLDLVFRVTQNTSGEWQLAEVRAGQDSWEELQVIAHSANVQLPQTNCDPVEQLRPQKSVDLSVKRARCLVAGLFGVQLPSDAVRIKSVSGLSLPLGSQSSAVVTAIVRLGFGFVKDSNGWRVETITSGGRDWPNVESIAAAVAATKAARARDEMRIIASALDKYRQERGGFVVSDKHPALIDHLSPRYLARVIRLDPWHHPYHYQGDRDRYTLRSAGPDGKQNTPDDVVLSFP